MVILNDEEIRGYRDLFLRMACLVVNVENFELLIDGIYNGIWVIKSCVLSQEICYHSFYRDVCFVPTKG